MKMDFVALLSGGKDSCYNIYQSIQHNHCLVCVANLYPPENGEQELNSFMYQSAGFTVIPAIAECLGVPLIRRPISGKAKDVTLEYTARAGEEDEVEDLYELLKEVKGRFPTVKAVSCGAIVSNYQRHRVETICQRLGWVVLAYLWQRDRPQLIREVVEKGFDIVLVKVAGAGLQPYKHLGKRVSELLPQLFRFHTLYGLDVCGEGGEYESLVLDGPIFKKRIVITGSEIVLDSEDESVGNLVITSYIIEDKPSDHILIPNIIDHNELLLDNVLELGLSAKIRHGDSESIQYDCIAPSSLSAEDTALRLSYDSMGLGSSTLLYSQYSSSCGNLVRSFREQFLDIFSRLLSLLSHHSLQLKDTLFVHVYLSSMEHFGQLNEAYGKVFEQFHPPSRSCIETTLPEGKLVGIEIFFLRKSYEDMSKPYIREVLHVKSLSNWAPQCIGPYSQANVIHNSLLLIAGQIPLIPATMQLPNLSDSSPLASLAADLYQCLHNIHGILSVLDSDFNSILTMIVYVNSSTVEVCRELFEHILTTIPFMMKRLTTEKTIIEKQVEAVNSDEYGEEDDDESSDEQNEAFNVGRDIIITLVAVSNLPRNARVECEVSALKTTTLPVEKLEHISGQYTDQTTATKRSSDDRNSYFSSPLERWDIWNADTSLPPTHSALLSINKVMCLDNLPMSYSEEFEIRFEIRYYPHCLAAIGINIALKNSKTTSLSLSNLSQGLCFAIQHIISISSMCAIYMRSIRCFVANYSGICLDTFQESLENTLQLVMSVSPAVICIPVPQLAFSNAATPCIISVQVLALDLQQIETEAWIAKEK